MKHNSNQEKRGFQGKKKIYINIYGEREKIYSFKYCRMIKSHEGCEKAKLDDKEILVKSEEDSHRKAVWSGFTHQCLKK